MGANSEVLLSPEALRGIEISVRGRLRARRLSEDFIDRHLEDSVAQGLLEYVAALRGGTEIENSAAWLVASATNRAVDEARREDLRRRTAEVDLGAEALRDPDPVADRGLTRAALPDLFRAIQGLSPEDRQLLSLRFYEEKTTRETARELFVSETSVRRRSAVALAKLRVLLGVKPTSAEDSFDSKLHGALAWLALGGGARVVPRRGPLRYVSDSFADARRAVAESRGAEHLQRLLPYSGDGIGAAIKGPIGWAAGACAGAVAVCAATGVSIGPVLSHHNAQSSPPPAVATRREVAPSKPPPPPVRHPAARPAPQPVASATASEPVAEAPTSSNSKPTPRTNSRKTAELKTHQQAKAKQSQAQTEVRQVEEQTSGIARAAAESSPEEAAPEVAASTSAAPAVVKEAVVVPSSSASSSKESGSSGEEQAENEFGAFK